MDASTVPESHESIADLEIDITAHRCPMTFVHTRLALDRLVAGQVLAVRMAGEEPSRNVPRSATEQGHSVIGQEQNPDGTSVILIRKGG